MCFSVLYCLILLPYLFYVILAFNICKPLGFPTVFFLIHSPAPRGILTSFFYWRETVLAKRMRKKIDKTFETRVESRLSQLPKDYFIEFLFLLYKHQWNTRWAFARKHIFTRENNIISHVKITCWVSQVLRLPLL